MHTPRQQATLLFALASVLSGLNVTLLMPAAGYPGAGLFTQALPFVLLALMLGLVVAGARAPRPAAGAVSRAETLRRVQGPYLVATVALALAGAAALVLGPRGQVNWWGTALLMLAPVADTLRCVAVYRRQDEYGQALMLRSAALAFAGVMGALLALSLLSSARGSADFAAGTMVGVYVAGYATFVLTRVVLARRGVGA